MLLSSLNSIKSRCHLLKTSERQGMARLQFACSYTCYSWHESELPVITEYALAVPFWYFCVGGVRRNRELALCCNHSFRKGFSRWSCFLWTKHLGSSELSKGGNCWSYKMALFTYLCYWRSHLMWPELYVRSNLSSSEPQNPGTKLDASEPFPWFVHASFPWCCSRGLAGFCLSSPGWLQHKSGNHNHAAYSLKNKHPNLVLPELAGKCPSA